jgi:hypothetical protein
MLYGLNGFIYYLCMNTRNPAFFLLASVVSSLELILIQTSAYAFNSHIPLNSIRNVILKNSPELNTTNQKRIMLADGKNGLCEGKFEHPTGNVTFNTDPEDGRLLFSFQLSPSSRLLTGDTVSGYMIEAIVQDYKINPPYGPHLNRESSYDFHGSILDYNRLGSKGSFRLQTGNKAKLIWFVKGVGARSKVYVLRAVECKAV